MKKGGKKAQVWVETVVYTLIAFVIIGAVLTFVKPKIQEIQDKAIIEQSITMLKGIDSTVSEITQEGAGNKRKIELGIKKGILNIDGSGDKLIFELESTFEYSEPGKEIQNENLLISTEKKGRYNTITLTMNYTGKQDIKNFDADEPKFLTKSPTPYTLFASNNGGSPAIINFELM